MVDPRHGWREVLQEAVLLSEKNVDSQPDKRTLIDEGGRLTQSLNRTITKIRRQVDAYDKIQKPTKDTRVMRVG